MMEAPNELRPRHQGQISLDKHVKWSDSAMYRTISKLTYYFLMKCQHQNLQVQVPTFESDANGVLNTEHLLGISAIASDELGTGLVAEGRRSSRGHLQKFCESLGWFD